MENAAVKLCRKRRKPLRQKSDRQRVIDDCLDSIRGIHKIKYAGKCFICGKGAEHGRVLGNFHILERKTYPRLTLCRSNILLACNLPCHMTNWHRHRQDEIKNVSIPRMFGFDDYETVKEHLLIQQSIMPKMSMFNLHMAKEVLKIELQALKGA